MEGERWEDVKWLFDRDDQITLARARLFFDHERLRFAKKELFRRFLSDIELFWQAFTLTWVHLEDGTSFLACKMPFPFDGWCFRSGKWYIPCCGNVWKEVSADHAAELLLENDVLLNKIFTVIFP